MDQLEEKTIQRLSEEEKHPKLDAKISMAKNRATIRENPMPYQSPIPPTHEEGAVGAQAQSVSQSSAVPSPIENRWAGEKLAEELSEVEDQLLPESDPREEEDSSYLDRFLQELDAEPMASPPAKTRKSLGRTNQVKIRLTDSEMAQFRRRVKKSGLSQGDFLRSAAIIGQIIVEERSMVDIAVLDELAMIRAELGRQGGLLKLTIKPNEGRRELLPAEWNELIGAIRSTEKLKKRLGDLEVKIARGSCNTQDE